MSQSPKSPERGIKRSKGTMNFPSLILPTLERQSAFDHLPTFGTPVDEKKIVTVTTFTIDSMKKNESPKRPELKRGKPAYPQKKTSTPSPTRKKKHKHNGGKKKQNTKKRRR